MKTIFRHKYFVAFLSILALGALVLLATGLRDVVFRPAVRFKSPNDSAFQFSLTKLMDDLAEVPFWQHVAVWLTVLLIVVLIGMVLSPELRKWLIRTFLRFTLFMLTVTYLFMNYKLPAIGLNSPAVPAGLGANSNSELPPAPDFIPPRISPWVSYLISFGFAVLIVGLLFILNRWWVGRRGLITPPRPLPQIANIARDSLRDLSAGADWDDVILNCYKRMYHAVSSARGIHRRESMTPGEFAAQMEKAGVPADAVRRLTQLFEAVRYGAHKSNRSERDLAVECLAEILQYCGEPV